MESKLGVTRDQERVGRKRRGSRGSGEEKRGSPGTGFVMLNCLSRPMFSLSPPLLPLPHSVDNTIVNHRGIDYEGLIFSTSEREHDSGSGREVASAACVRDSVG